MLKFFVNYLVSYSFVTLKSVKVRSKLMIILVPHTFLKKFLSLKHKKCSQTGFYKTNLQKKNEEPLKTVPQTVSPFVFTDVRRNIHESQLLTKYVHENLRCKDIPGKFPGKKIMLHRN